MTINIEEWIAAEIEAEKQAEIDQAWADFKREIDEDWH